MGASSASDQREELRIERCRAAVLSDLSQATTAFLLADARGQVIPLENKGDATQALKRATAAHQRFEEHPTGDC